MYIGISDPQYQFLLANRDKKEVHLYGSSDSAKTWSLAEFFTFELLLKYKHIKFNCIKKIRASVKFAIYAFWKERLQEWKINCSYHDTDLIITFPNGNLVSCMGLDKLQKTKGRFCNYVWINETTELTLREYLQSKTWAREQNINSWVEEIGKKKITHRCINQIFCDYNPEDINSFLKPMTENVPKNFAIKQFTYKDNAFITPDRVEEIESWKNQDETYFKIYGLGTWGSLKGLIYQFGLNWDIVNNEQWVNCDDIEYGLDFGYTAPTALVELGYAKSPPKDCPEAHKNKQHIYERAVIYKTHMTVNDLLEEMKEKGISKNRKIVADSEDPGDIETIRKAGYNIHPATKEQHSVIAGIKKVKECFIHHHEDSQETINENRSYKFKTDKNGNPIDEPAKIMNHTKDAERYNINERSKNVKIFISSM